MFSYILKSSSLFNEENSLILLYFFSLSIKYFFICSLSKSLVESPIKINSACFKYFWGNDLIASNNISCPFRLLKVPTLKNLIFSLEENFFIFVFFEIFDTPYTKFLG